MARQDGYYALHYASEQLSGDREVAQLHARRARGLGVAAAQIHGVPAERGGARGGASDGQLSRGREGSANTRTSRVGLRARVGSENGRGGDVARGVSARRDAPGERVVRVVRRGVAGVGGRGFVPRGSRDAYRLHIGARAGPI